MKRILMNLFVAGTISIFACKQKFDASNVPESVKASFAKQFPGATAKWSKDEGNYEAEFELNENKMSAVFDANGSMEESEMEIKVQDLPSNTAAYVNEHYKGKTIDEAEKITKADGTVNYEIEIDGKEVIFDSAGNFLKEEKD